MRGQALVGVVATVGSTVAGFLATAAIAHIAGPDALGGYLVVVACLNVLLLLGDPGLGAAAIQRIAEGNEPDAYFSAYVGARAVIAVLLLLALPLLPGIDRDLLIWIGAAVVVSTMSSIAATGILATARAGIAWTADFVGAVVRALVQVGTTLVGLGVPGLVAGFVAGSAAVGLVDRRFLTLRLARFGRHHLSGLAPFALWSFLAALVAVASANGDTLLVGALLTQTDVALYRVPLQLASLAAIAGLPIRSAIVPHLVRAAHGADTDTVATTLGRAHVAAFTLAAPVVVGGALCADRLLGTLYGTPFAAGAVVLVIALIAAAVGLVPLLDGAAVAAFGHPHRQFGAAAVGAVAMIALDALLIPSAGIVGAAIALLAGSVVTAVATWRYRARLVAVRLDQRLLAAVAVATVVMGATVAALLAVLPPSGPIALACAVACGGAVYACALAVIAPSLRREAMAMILKRSPSK